MAVASGVSPTDMPAIWPAVVEVAAGGVASAAAGRAADSAPLGQHACHRQNLNTPSGHRDPTAATTGMPVDAAKCGEVLESGKPGTRTQVTARQGQQEWSCERGPWGAGAAVEALEPGGRTAGGRLPVWTSSGVVGRRTPPALMAASSSRSGR